MTQSYHNLYLAAVAAHPEKSKKNVQQETNVLWKDIKENKKNYNEELNRLKIKAKRSKTSLLTYWATRPKPTATSPEVVVVSSSGPSTDQQAPPQLDEIETPPDADNSTADAPAQIKLNEELSQAAKKIADFHIVQRTVGLSNVHKKELNTLINLKQSLEKKMKRLVINQKAQQKQRVKKRKAMEELVQSNPEAAKKLKSKGSVGRPPVETHEDMAGLHQAIMSIVVPESSCDERRRSEIYNSCQSLDSLRTRLAEIGYTLTRTALYYRLVSELFKKSFLFQFFNSTNQQANVNTDNFHQ